MLDMELDDGTTCQHCWKIGKTRYCEHCDTYSCTACFDGYCGKIHPQYDGMGAPLNDAAVREQDRVQERMERRHEFIGDLYHREDC